jgi:aspartyl-tRNA(Asn)/glutamyl-tRNA(Gln) amidotransferase subunit A
MLASSRTRLEQALSTIADPNGEGARACLTLYKESALAAADAADKRARAGISLGPLDGKIVTIKDLFDVAGEVTRAGSKILADEGKPASADAPVIARLRRAGAVIAAKTNMVEFAFSAIGTNPHYGTPGNPADRARVPGGSTSGGAVAVADGMCELTIGSDTGGSTRIPAALCGITGFKPSRQRVPTDGAFPLSCTLDSIGPMAGNVKDCADADAIMAREEPGPFAPAPPSAIRLGIARGRPLDGLDATVSARFSSAISMFGKAGLRIADEKIPLIDEMAALVATGWLPPPEGLVVHQDRLKRRPQDFDPNIRVRLERAAAMPAAHYIATLQERGRLIRAMHDRLADLDGLVMPATPIVAPTIAEVSDATVFAEKNLLLIRNTAIANCFDLCAITLPIPGTGLPVGLMIVSRNGDDRKLFRIALAIEAILDGKRAP